MLALNSTRLRVIILVGLFPFLFTNSAHADTDPPLSIGARAASLGHAFTGVRGDFWSLFHNPASIASISSLQTGLTFERRFMLQELTYGAAGVVVPFSGQQAIGLQLSSFGFEAYRENEIGLSYGITFLERFSVGTGIRLANVNIKDYGSTFVIMAEAGINTLITDQLSLGFRVYNANRAQLVSETAREDIPTILSVGLCYRPTDRVMVVADVHKDLDHPVSYRGGVEYQISTPIIARVGVTTEPLSWNAGLGVNFNEFSFDTAFGFQENLGYTPHLSLTYRIGQRNG